jgi:hypothetical protein
MIYLLGKIGEETIRSIVLSNVGTKLMGCPAMSIQINAFIVANQHLKPE